MWRLVLVVSLLCCSSEASVSCRDENGAEVDWFILYKTPKSLKDGLGYVYIHPDNNKVIQSGVNKNPINHPDGILAKTLHQLLHFDIKNPSETFGFISYNDQPPGCNAQSEKFGHSKGVVMVEKDEKDKTGVWLIHSTPRFPFTRDPKTFYPPSGQDNAQIFMCVTFNYDQFKHIGKHLQYIRAFPFDHHIPEGLEEELRKAAEWRDWGEATPSGLYQQPRSKGGQMFDSITTNGPKNKQDDFYDTISEKFGIDLKDLKVQTWHPGRDYSESEETVMGVKTGLGEWETGNDHSKWCVATDKGKQLFCIADLNRDQKRWGGALCFENEKVKDMFNKFVSDAKPKTQPVSGAKPSSPKRKRKNGK